MAQQSHTLDKKWSNLKTPFDKMYIDRVRRFIENMGWYFLHKDTLDEAKRLGRDKCVICEQPIKEDERVYFVSFEKLMMNHADCVWEKEKAVNASQKKTLDDFFGKLNN